MKTIDLVLRLVAALIAIGAAIYAIAKYGDKLVAWAKEHCPSVSVDIKKEVVITDAAEPSVDEVVVDAPAEEAPVEEAAAEEAPAEEAAAEEAPAEEAVSIPEGEPVAEEADFEE